MPSQSPLERRVASLILLGFLALVILPYAIAPLILPRGMVWGGLLGSADDQNVHLMWARQARDGAIFFRDLFTTESLISGDKPLFFNVLPFAVGILAKISRVDVAFPYHVLRVALGAWALWQFHLLALAATQNEAKWSRARILSLALLAFTTGSGFLAHLPYVARFFFVDRPDGNFPLMPEAYFLLSAFAYPLNIASFGLLALIFRHILAPKNLAIPAIAAVFLGNIHTYDSLPLILTLMVWACWQLKARGKAGAKVSLITIFGALLPIAYQFFVFRGSEEFRVKALTPTAPPDLVSMLLAFAPLLILAAFSIKKWRELPAMPLLATWVIATFVLVYTPTTIFSFARKMIEGVQIPLVLLAGIGLSALLSQIAAPQGRKIAAALVLGVLALSPLQYFGWLWNNTLENNAQRWHVFMPPLALSQGDVGALQFINNQEGDGAILCLPYIGSYAPRATGKWTYAGHWAETLHFLKGKYPYVARYYSGQMSPVEAVGFLRQNRIAWVVEGQFERSLTSGTSPSAHLGLKPIWTGGDAENGPTTVFAVP